MRAAEERSGYRDDGSETTVTSSLENLVSGSQGMVTKRLDLAMLEGEELLSRTAERMAWNGAALILAAGAWFAAARSLVLYTLPAASPALQMATFALGNGGAAIGLALLASRRGRAPAALQLAVVLPRRDVLFAAGEK